MTNEATGLDKTIEAKLGALRGILKGLDSVVVAYSGGVDSTFLLKVAADALGERALAVTAVSETYTSDERASAVEFARSIGARHVVITTEELADPRFHQNPPERCYYCKKELFDKLTAIAKRERLNCVVDASNVDDCSDYRPGRKAAVEAGVRSPLIEASITKKEVRILSKAMGLPTWNKPAAACLASRFPYGETITREKLERVERAERFLRGLGLSTLRVRAHGNLARIEVDAERVGDVAKNGVRDDIVRELKSLGFKYVTIDLQGYRTGSLNEEL